MLSPEEEMRLLEEAAARGWLSRTSLAPPDEEQSSTEAAPVTPRWGGRIDRLVARGDLTPSVVEQLLSEVQPQGSSVSRVSRASSVPRPPMPSWERYELIRLIGEGGMGVVYEARDRRLQRTVALKFIRGEHQAGARRFLQEARAQARIEHDNVCKVYEVGEFEGRAYIAMELIQGLPLNQAAAQLRLEERVRVLIDVAAASHAAHRIGVIHRDLKPSNVMVQRREEGTLRATVMDFGLAHDPQADDKLTRTGAVLGTPAYMSPEQARGDTRSVDRRSDVYSLGAMLYELLTSQPPFRGTSTVETLLKVLHEDPEPVRGLVPTVPRDLETIAHKCLEKTPERRYESAQALGRDLQAYLDGAPILAQPASLPGRIWRRLRHHRLLVAVSALSLLALSVLSGVLVRARLQAAQKVRIAQLFGEQARELESIMQHGYTAPLHDIGRERSIARKLLQRVEEQMRAEGSVASGPGHYALGRGHLAMQDYAQALAQLETARRAGYETPGLSYALGRTHAELYRTEWSRTEFINDAEMQKARRAELDRLYRQPAIAYLTAYVGTGSDVGAGEFDYVEALLTYCRGDYPQALVRAQQAVAKVPWLYEAKRLEGDAYMALGLARVDAADFEAALLQFDRARAAYESAAQFARSDALVRNGLARSFLHTLGSGSLGLRRPPGTVLQAILDATAQSLAADPQQADAYRIRLEGYQYLFQYQEVRNELGPEIDEAITLAEELRQTRPELTPTLLAYYLLRLSHKITHGLDPTADFIKTESLADAFFRRKDINQIITPADSREALDIIGTAALKRAKYSLNTGHDPAIYYETIERWLGEQERVPAAQSDAQLHRGRYLILRGEALLKQGLSPMAPLNEALRLFERLEASGVHGINHHPANAYADMLYYQSLIHENININQEKLRLYMERIEHDRHAWLWRMPTMFMFYISLARSELSAGRDPSTALTRLASVTARCQQIASCAFADSYEAQGELLRATWLLGTARDAAARDAGAIETSLATASRHVSAALRAGTPQDNIYRIAAELARRQAEWSLQKKRPRSAVSAAIREGLLFAERARALDPMDQEALAIEGVLHLLAARATPGAAEGRRSAQAAVSRLTEALTKNPLLRNEYEPLRSEATRVLLSLRTGSGCDSAGLRCRRP